jgi:hypothetical protein
MDACAVDDELCMHRVALAESLYNLTSSERVFISRHVVYTNSPYIGMYCERFRHLLSHWLAGIGK